MQSNRTSVTITGTISRCGHSHITFTAKYSPTALADSDGYFRKWGFETLMEWAIAE